MIFSGVNPGENKVLYADTCSPPIKSRGETIRKQSCFALEIRKKIF